MSAHAVTPWWKRIPARVSMVLLLGTGALLAVHAWWYYPFFSDDALISLRYSQRFSEGLGLTWTAGERVEGYTNFLWVLLVAAAGRLGLDYLWSARVLDFIGALLALVSVAIDRTSLRIHPARVLSGALMLAASVPLAVWAIGGLEHGFMAGVLAVALLLLERRGHGLPASSAQHGGLAACLAALVLLRADGVVLVAALLLGAALQARLSFSGMRSVLKLALVPLASWLAQLAFRRWYYGSFQPNTALAKLAFNQERLNLGADYLAQGYLALAVLAGAAVLGTGALARIGRARATVPAWALVAVWSGYQWAVGGDIFPGWRQLLFPVVALAVIVAEAATWIATAYSAQPALWILAAIVHWWVQASDSENRRAKAELWEWAGLPIGTVLKQAFGSRAPLLAVDAAGALPYWSELPCLDMLGLNDRYIASHPPPSFGKGQIGHELGDGAYVLSRRPDLIAFNNASGARMPIFLSGRQLLGMRDFHREYQLVTVRAEGPVLGDVLGELWVRRLGGKLGVQRSDTGVWIPGYFLTGQESDAVSRLDPEGRLVAEISPLNPGRLPALELPEGRYQLKADASEADLMTAVRCGGYSLRRVSPSTDLVVELQRPTALGVVVAPEQGSAFVRALEWVRTSAPASWTCLGFREPLLRDASELSNRRSENTDWAHPGNVLFGNAGLVIQFPAGTRAQELELSVDNNDDYLIELGGRGQVLFSATIGPRQNGGGLAVHRRSLPMRIDDVETVKVTPSGGDHHYSLGHLVLEP